MIQNNDELIQAIEVFRLLRRARTAFLEKMKENAALAKAMVEDYDKAIKNTRSEIDGFIERQ